MKPFKILITDVDGSLTDSRISVSENGDIIKTFNLKDLVAMKMVQDKNIPVVIITGNIDDCIRQYYNRMENIYKGKLFIYTAVKNKYEKINDILKKWELNWEDVAYFGDGSNDLESMQHSRWTGCPKDANEEIIKESHYISDKNGGDGCLDDFVKNFILKD